MPTYEYACSKCGHAFEHFQSMRDEPLTQCPKCKKKGLRRLIGGGAGLIFKGSGFYITDYKKKPSGDDKAASEPKTATPAAPATTAAADKPAPPAKAPSAKSSSKKK